MYQKVSGSKLYVLFLYRDDILLAINGKELLHHAKQFLLKKFNMKNVMRHLMSFALRPLEQILKYCVYCKKPILVRF